MDNKTGRFYRHPGDRVMPGIQMRECLETHLLMLREVAKKAGVPTRIVNNAYHGEAISREEWHKIAGVFRLLR